MRNPGLARDYLRRAKIRLAALDVLFEGESWADVVRESQEIVELALKGLLRFRGIDPPRVHDVSEVLLAERQRLPTRIAREVESLAEWSRHLRRDRELAFSATAARRTSRLPDSIRGRTRSTPAPARAPRSSWCGRP